MFLFLAIMNNNKLCAQAFAWTYVFDSPGFGIRNSGSHANSMFNFLKNCRTVLPSSCTVLHSHQQRVSIPTSPRPHQHLLLPIFLTIAVLVDMKQYLTVVLICISLMTNVVEYLFICSLGPLVHFQTNVCSTYLPIFKLSYLPFYC